MTHRPCRTNSRSTTLVLGAASAVLICPTIVSTVAWASTPPEVIRLTGTIRDFPVSHPDFGVVPAAGYGHYAGSVALTADADGCPTLAGTGFKVTNPWLDVDGNPLPPHLYLDPASGGGGTNGNTVIVQDGPAAAGNSTTDSFDSAAGPYGGDNVGEAPTWSTGNILPAISPPVGLPVVDEFETVGGTQTLDSSFECSEFIIRTRATVNVEGDVVIVATDNVEIFNRTTINLEPGATLTLWVGKDFEIANRARLNVNTADPTRFTINYYGSDGNTFKIENNTAVYANVNSPNHGLLIRNSAELMGVFTGKKLTLEAGGSYHHDDLGSSVTAAPQVCGVDTSDTAGTFGAASTGGISSSASFECWFRDVLGTNLSTSHAISLVDDGTGVFRYENPAFHPIDGRMYGNEGLDHNYHFTFAFTTTFEYSACVGQFFEFEGADDAWLFIDGALAMDLGGIVPGTRQYVPIDRLGLTDGETYSISFFHAQREDAANFNIRTNLPLVPTYLPMVGTAAFD